MDEGRRLGNKYINEALPVLKEIVDQNGVEHLHKKPYAVYTRLKSRKTDPRICRVVLVSLLAGASELAVKMDEKELSAYFQKECCLKKLAADQVSQMWAALFGKNNREEWEKNKGQGLRNFCKNIWEHSWDGEATWYSGGGVHIDCWCSGRVVLKVTDEAKVQGETVKLLKMNPFTPEEKIFDYYKDILDKKLDEELEDYVTCDDYYPPVMEDYYGNFEYAAQQFCEKYGFTLVEYDCDGTMSDFEPDFDRHRW